MGPGTKVMKEWVTARADASSLGAFGRRSADVRRRGVASYSPSLRSLSDSPVSSHSRQIQSPARGSRALSAAGTIVTPQAAQMGGRSSFTFAASPSAGPH